MCLGVDWTNLFQALLTRSVPELAGVDAYSVTHSLGSHSQRALGQDNWGRGYYDHGIRKTL